MFFFKTKNKSVYKQVLPRIILHLLILFRGKFKNNIESVSDRIPVHGICHENLSRSKWPSKCVGFWGVDVLYAFRDVIFVHAPARHETW